MNINLTSYGQGTPVVFFHGWGFDHHVWLPLVPDLKDQYQLILVDLPGFGLTSMMDWMLFKTLLLQQLPLHFAMAGWSLGGLYAQRLALEEPQRISSLMSIASSPCFIADNFWPGVSKEVFRNFYKNLTQDPDKTLKDFIRLQLNKAKVPFYMGEVPTREALEVGLEILSEWDLREELTHLSVPACFIFGRLDPIAPAGIMSEMEVLYPQFNYQLFKHSAHMPFLSHKGLFIEAFRRFIK